MATDLHNTPSESHRGSFVFLALPIILVLIIAILWIGRDVIPPSQTQQGSEEEIVLSEKDILISPQKSGIDPGVYNQQVARYAERAETLILNENCSMSPLVLELTSGDTLTIQNNDQYIHTISFEQKDQFTVSPGRSRTIDLTEVFGIGSGIYRYGCGDISVTDNTGVLYITE